MEFSRPEYCSGSPILSPADLPDPGIKPGSPASQVHSLTTEIWKKKKIIHRILTTHENYRVRKCKSTKYVIIFKSDFSTN